MPEWRYGGLADNGMKEDFCRGMLAIGVVLALSDADTLKEVPGLADEVNLLFLFYFCGGVTEI